MRKFIYALLLAPLTIINAADNPVKDGNFESFGKPGSPWQSIVEKDGIAELAKDSSVKGNAVHLKSAQIKQDMNLTDGLMELTVIARGQGELTLCIESIGERTQAIGKESGLYGYLFESKAGSGKVIAIVRGDAFLGNASIQPATDEQKATWKKAQESFQQFGFMTVSPQRPTPGASPLNFEGAVKPLVAMRQCAIMDEPRMNVNHPVNVPRLLQFLGDNGFARLDGEKIAAWMAERIAKRDAYGSVVVFPGGVQPSTILEGPDTEPLFLKYLRAGGRMVIAGDVPFSTVESPTAKPFAFNSDVLGLLGLSAGWHSPYWGQGGLPVTRTAASDAWGLENSDAPITGFAVESISLAFGVYTVPSIGKQGAANWFKNVRPDMPWSGLVKILQGFDGNNDATLRDVWRAAHYVGKPVTIPALPPPILPPPAPQLLVTMGAGGMTNRHEFVRGEKVTIDIVVDPALKADAVRVELIVPVSGVKKELPAQGGKTKYVLDTSPYAYGEYKVVMTALNGSNVLKTVTETIGIRYVPPETFNFEMWHAAGSNPLRTDLEFADIHAAGMELYLAQPSNTGVDACIRHGMGFSIRADANPGGLVGKDVTFEKDPEYFRFGPDGKPISAAGYSGGRPSFGISHPEARKCATKMLQQAVEQVAQIPAFRPYVLCNDDFQSWYGWDYAPHVLEAFKKDTGLEAPRKMIMPEKFGPIPDNQPWVKWFEWTLINVDGAFNKAETQGVVQARSDAKVGPIPGGMQIPLVCMWEPSQYPPYNFGRNGFNLISSYYYNSYWQPVMTATFWMEIGRMGNRDLPQWNMPDAFSTAGYTRNNFYHYLAGGVHGLAYFLYTVRNENTWPEFQRLGQIVRRIGPVQTQLVPARRDIGLLDSFTSNCFEPGHTIVQVYAYHNLMQGHFDLEMVSEDEIVAGRAAQYKAILLYNVQYLRQSVYDALVKHVANGGLVILDSTIPFDIPGAKRLDVDIGMGKKSTKPFQLGVVQASNPGISDYGHADRIEVVKQALSQYVKPRFDSTDIKLVASRFEADGVPYTWFVNAQDGKEYMSCRDPYCDPAGRKPAKMKQVSDWETAETEKGSYTSLIIMDSRPGVPYDLVKGRQLAVEKRKDGRYAVTVSMDRFGGALVAWLPEEIVSLKLDVPRSGHPNESLKFSASLHGKGGGWFGFGKGKIISGALPVEFVLKDPNGKEHVVSGVRAIHDGSAILDWTPAENDPAGKWTLTAKDLTSGKTAECKIYLNKKK